MQTLKIPAASVAWCAALLLVSLLSPSAHAQLVGDEPQSPAEREQAFRSLARDVLALEKQLGIVKRVAKLVSPSVVHIEAVKTRQPALGYGSRGGVEEAGSGVIVVIDKKTYVMTNRHVIKYAQPERIKITLADGRFVRPSKVWSDRGTDIAVMAVTAPRLVGARLGNSDKMEIGDFVVAFGSPFGLSRSITYGLISARGRRDLELGEDGVRFQNFMQTDAAINPGNSGGPLTNLRGEVVGINTAIASSSGGNEGIGFTIPINMAMVVVHQLIDHGSVTRAFLGVNLDSRYGPTVATRLGLPRPMGARVTGVTDGSPAALAKLQVDDVILQFNGIRIEDDNHLVNLVGLTAVDTEVPILIFRKKKSIPMRVRVGKRVKFATN